MLKIENIRKTFFPGTINERVALDGLSLHLAEGDFVTVIGSNGAGKSTLLNAVAGKLIVDEGLVEIDGTKVNKLPEYKRARYVGRPASASTAAGLMSRHMRELQNFLADAFA